MMITAQLRPPSPGASMLPPHMKFVGDRARAGPDRHIRRMMSYVLNLRECATGHNPVAGFGWDSGSGGARSASAVGGPASGRGSEADDGSARPASAVGGVDLDVQFGGGGRALLGGERIDDLVDERLQEQPAQLADHDGHDLLHAVPVGR